MISWIEQWYGSHCNGQWEHEFGIKINTLDNPGWSVEIDLTNTEIESLELGWTMEEKSETDWIGYSITDKVFKGVGDSGKLGEILKLFSEIWEASIKKNEK